MYIISELIVLNLWKWFIIEKQSFQVEDVGMEFNTISEYLCTEIGEKDFGS